MSRRRFHRISHPEVTTYYSFNPDKIESVHMAPDNREGEDFFKIEVVMSSGKTHVIVKETHESALSIFCSLTNAPPPSTSFDDVTKSYFPGGN